MLLVSLILALVGGALAGGAMLLADQVGFYLIIAFPIFAGMIIGFMYALPFHGRNTTPAVASTSLAGAGLASPVVQDSRPGVFPLFIIGLLGTLACVGVYWVGSYMVEQNNIVALIQEEDPSVADAEAREWIQLYYEDEYGTAGFPGYLQDVAAAGISITRTGSSSGGFTLDGTAAYIYWGVEILLILFCAVTNGISRARALPEEPKAEEAAAA